MTTPIRSKQRSFAKTFVAGPNQKIEVCRDGQLLATLSEAYIQVCREPVGVYAIRTFRGFESPPSHHNQSSRKGR